MLLLLPQRLRSTAALKGPCAVAQPPLWLAGCPGQWWSTCAAAVAAAPGVSQQAPEVFGTPPCSPTETLPRRSAQPSPSTGIAPALAVAIVGEQRLPSSRWRSDEPKGMGPVVTWGCPEQWQRRLHRLRQRATVLLLLLPQPQRSADTLKGRSHSAQPQARRVHNPPTLQPSLSQPPS